MQNSATFAYDYSTYFSILRSVSVKSVSVLLTLGSPRWGGGEGAKYTISPKGKEGKVEKEKKIMRSAPMEAKARIRDLPRARWESPAARHRRCLDKQAYPCL